MQARFARRINGLEAADTEYILGSTSPGAGISVANRSARDSSVRECQSEWCLDGEDRLGDRAEGSVPETI